MAYGRLQITDQLRRVVNDYLGFELIKPTAVGRDIVSESDTIVIDQYDSPLGRNETTLNAMGHLRSMQIIESARRFCYIPPPSKELIKLVGKEHAKMLNDIDHLDCLMPSFHLKENRFIPSDKAEILVLALFPNEFSGHYYLNDNQIREAGELWKQLFSPPSPSSSNL